MVTTVAAGPAWHMAEHHVAAPGSALSYKAGFLLFNFYQQFKLAAA
jgi:hypothetical protein